MLNKKYSLTISILSLILTILFVSGAFSGLYQSGRNLYNQVEVFHAVLSTIHQTYVEEKDPDVLLEDAIEGMISKLDPHTNFMTADDFKNWNQRFDGYSGIGIFFDVLKDKITILSVIKDGPSDQVGLMAGDQIVEIDGESAIGIKRDDVPLKLMGPRGTKVNIKVERTGWTEPHPYTLIRDEIHLESVPFASMIKPGLGYILVNRFSSTTPKEFVEAFLKLEEEGLQSLIIDFRNNGGGYMEAAVEITDIFLPGGKRIVYTQGRIEESFREFFSSSRMTKKLYPVIVMQNRTSASASEIVAGALQDWDRGLVVGETSFGKGLVQSQFKYNDGSALMITTARYHTPSGRVIQRPYDNKSLEDYYRQAITDEGREENEHDKNRKKFKTLVLKREVYSSGGITPDIFLKTNNDTLPSRLRGLVYSPRRLIFTFVRQKVDRDRFEKMGVDTFVTQYTPDEKMMNKFRKFIKSEDFEIKESILLEGDETLQFLIKQQIAASVWDDHARYRVQLQRDHQLHEAITYMQEAEALVKQAYK